MKYKVEIPDVINIGTAYSISELVNILEDGGCIHKMTISKLCRITDCLERDGCYDDKFQTDPRYRYLITKVKE